MMLRDFLYLDRPLVRDFLAQAEGGLIDESTERTSASGKAGLGGGLGAGPLSLKGEKGKEQTEETEAVIRQVAASEFDRLYSYLEDNGLICLEDADAHDDLAEVRRTCFVELDARVRVSGINQLGSLAASLAALLPMLESFGSDTSIDEKTLEGMNAIAAMSQADSSIPVIASVPGSLGFVAGLELDPVHCLVDSWDIDASVLLKVQRVLKGDDRYVLGDPFGGLLKLATPEAQEELFSSLRTGEALKLGISGDFAVYAPGVIGTAVAIYR
jgi:hypothetical protein